MTLFESLWCYKFDDVTDIGNLHHFLALARRLIKVLLGIKISSSLSFEIINIGLTAISSFILLLILDWKIA